MKCFYCGTSLSPEAAYCGECGKPLKNVPVIDSREVNKMLKWNYSMKFCSVSSSSPEFIWKHKYKDGTSDFDGIAELGREGWELVAVTPLANYNGETTTLLFTYKRPAE